jgi:hypothetical protein
MVNVKASMSFQVVPFDNSYLVRPSNSFFLVRHHNYQNSGTIIYWSDTEEHTDSGGETVDDTDLEAYNFTEESMDINEHLASLEDIGQK